MKRGTEDFLDPNKSHKLSELECELISVFRALTDYQRKAAFESMLNTAYYTIDMDLE